MQNANENGLARSWWIFIQERFAPVEHLSMVFFLTLGNSAMGCYLLGVEFQALPFVVSYLVAMLFFFRLRCFDEIKDYDVDLEINPTRPLARGVLTVSQVKTMFLVLTVAELAIVATVGMNALIVHAIAVAYSYLMYKEFFIGEHLSRHLTTYALTHTLVSVLVGYSIVAQNTGLSIELFPLYMLAFGLVNWALFNLFEFARKTYAPEEERPGVDTYSSLFHPLGAGLLSLSQVAFALVVLWYVSGANPARINVLDSVGGILHAGAAAIVLLVSFVYMAKPIAKTAALFRGVCSAYLVIFFLILSYQGLMF